MKIYHICIYSLLQSLYHIKWPIFFNLMGIDSILYSNYGIYSVRSKAMKYNKTYEYDLFLKVGEI